MAKVQAQQGPSCLELVNEQENAPLAVIDLTHLDQHFANRSLVIEEIGKACRRLGCFQVINHGIDQSIIKDALDVASEFFESSEEAKADIASEDITKPVRYGTSSKDGISMARAFLKHYAHPLDHWITLWPRIPPEYREKMGRYAVEERRVALQLMDAILESLGLGQAYLKDKLDEGMQFVAVNSYPKSSEPGVMIGLAPHTDYCLLTIVASTCQGLQFMEKEVWSTDTRQHPGALHVHVGDQLEVLSNGRYKSLVHRAVLHPEADRISIAGIHGLAVDEKVAAAKELVDDQHPKLYGESSFTDFMAFLSAKGITSSRCFLDSLRINQ